LSVGMKQNANTGGRNHHYGTTVIWSLNLPLLATTGAYCSPVSFRKGKFLNRLIHNVSGLAWPRPSTGLVPDNSRRQPPGPCATRCAPHHQSRQTHPPPLHRRRRSPTRSVSCCVTRGSPRRSLCRRRSRKVYSRKQHQPPGFSVTIDQLLLLRRRLRPRTFRAPSLRLFYGVKGGMPQPPDTTARVSCADGARLMRPLESKDSAVVFLLFFACSRRNSLHNPRVPHPRSSLVLRLGWDNLKATPHSRGFFRAKVSPCRGAYRGRDRDSGTPRPDLETYPRSRTRWICRPALGIWVVSQLI